MSKPLFDSRISSSDVARRVGKLEEGQSVASALLGFYGYFLAVTVLVAADGKPVCAYRNRRDGKVQIMYSASNAVILPNVKATRDAGEPELPKDLSSEMRAAWDAALARRAALQVAIGHLGQLADNLAPFVGGISSQLPHANGMPRKLFESRIGLVLADEVSEEGPPIWYRDLFQSYFKIARVVTQVRVKLHVPQMMLDALIFLAKGLRVSRDAAGIDIRISNVSAGKSCIFGELPNHSEQVLPYVLYLVPRRTQEAAQAGLKRIERRRVLQQRRPWNV